jgi:hypothetical protein
MSFSTLTTTEIAVGKPVTNDTQTKIKDNFDDHESRILNLEDGSAVAYPPIEMDIRGYYGDQGPATGWCKTVPNFNLEITGARLYIDVAGSAGDTEIDILVSRSGGAYTSIFTTKPKVNYAMGNDYVSINGVLDPTQVAVSAGDKIRLDTTLVQTDGFNLLVRIDYNKT